jgi:histidine triad (HIT) family protein
MASDLVDCLFCRIARGEAPGAPVFEDRETFAFLDARPLFPGHTLLVPRAHFETLADLPPALVGPLFERARLLSRAVERAFAAEGSFVAVNNRVSQSVPHLHVHVVPRRKKDGLRGFFWPRTTYESDEARRAAQEALRAAIAEIEAGAR